MSPRHHPSQSLLLEYAAGVLGPDRRFVVSAHVQNCPLCAEEVAFAEALGGVLLDALPAAEMRPEALSLALARVERPASVPPPAPPTFADWIRIPPEVTRAALARRRWAAPGVWVAPVARGAGGARSYLLRVGPGMSVPRHTHRGSEFVCVLKGAFTDRGEVHEPGDFIESDESVDHRPTVTLDGECICLVAADSRLTPLDWVGRLFQPVVGI